MVRAPPCHGGGRRFESDLGRLFCIWGLSSAGRASALQAEGHRFEPYRPHYNSNTDNTCRCGSMAEQLICNQQVIGSSPIIGFWKRIPYGWIPEWPKGTDCKSAANCFGGSNPPPSISSLEKYFFYCRAYNVLSNLISRGGAVWKLVGLITRRS